MRLSKGYCARYSRAKQKENPFVWTKTADEILACVALLCWRTLATGHLGDHLEDPLGSKNGQQESEAGGEQPRAICSELRRPLESAAATSRGTPRHKVAGLLAPGTGNANKLLH